MLLKKKYKKNIKKDVKNTAKAVRKIDYALGAVLDVLSYFTGGEKMNDSKKKPCSKCPYALGLVHTVTNPCPKCELNGYQSYEWFQKQLSGDSSISQKEK